MFHIIPYHIFSINIETECPMEVPIIQSFLSNQDDYMKYDALSYSRPSFIGSIRWIGSISFRPKVINENTQSWLACPLVWLKMKRSIPLSTNPFPDLLGEGSKILPSKNCLNRTDSTGKFHNCLIWLHLPEFISLFLSY